MKLLPKTRLIKAWLSHVRTVPLLMIESYRKIEHDKNQALSIQEAQSGSVPRCADLCQHREWKAL